MIGGPTSLARWNRQPPGEDGWRQVYNLTWSFNTAAYAPVYKVTTGGDHTSRFWPGMKVRLTHDSQTKYFVIVHRVYGYGYTVLWLYGGTDYTLSSGTISDFCFSTARIPNGWPGSPLKWTVRNSYTTNLFRNDPTVNCWYNLDDGDDAHFGQLAIPYGLWRVSYQYSLYVQTEAAQTNLSVGATLSTTQGTGTTAGETDTQFTSCIGGAGASGLLQAIGTVGRSKVVSQTATEAPKTYYLNLRTTHANMDWIGIIPQYHGSCVLEAECAYL